MRKFLLILVIMLPMLVMGQSKEADEYFYKGEELYFAKKYEDAINFFKKSDAIEKVVFNEDSVDYYRSELAISYCWLFLALNNIDLGEYHEAIKLIKQSIDVQKAILGNDFPDITIYLAKLQFCYYQLGMQKYGNGIYTEAITFFLKALDIWKQISGVKNTDYAILLTNLAGCYSKLGSYDEAISFITKALEIEENAANANDSLYYASSLSILATIKAELGDYNNCMNIEKKALVIREKVCGKKSLEYSFSLGNLAGYCAIIGDIKEAIKLENVALEIRKDSIGVNHSYYAFSLSNLAGYYNELGNYTEAIKLETSALEIRELSCGKAHPDVARSLSNLAWYVCQIGEYEEAIRLEKRALEIREKTLGKNHSLYATSLDNLAGYYSEIGKYDEAIRFASNALKIREQTFGKEHKDYAISLDNLAGHLSHNGNNKEAIILETKALEIRKNIFGINHYLYARSLDNIAFLSYKEGNYSDAIKLGTQAIDIYKKTCGEYHPYYAVLIKNLAYYNFSAGYMNKAIELLKQSYYSIERLILTNFISMTNKERTAFWNKNSFFFNKRLPFYAFSHPTSDLISLAYNGQLLSKGLLLNAELEIQKLIALSGNKDFEKRYYTLRENRIKLDKIYQQPISQRTLNTDSLSAIIEKDEKYLVEHIKELGDYTRNLSIEWQDVQKKLSNKDIAIEFASVNSNEYIALILKKGMTAPEVVKLSFSENDLANCYQSPSLYNAIWKPIEKYLNGVENVYFAPSGKFYTCAIEYLPDNSGNIFSKKYNVYRLSSTRELVLEKEVNSNKKASVFGGIVYDLTKDDWQNRNTIAQENVFRDIPNISDSRGLVFNYLSHTVRESNEIVNILRGVNYQVSLGIAKNATEESFKKLSGSGIKILHIATHGYYEPENKEKKYSDLLLLSDKQNSTEDRSLSHSWLLFAGGTTILDPEKRNDIPEGRDDGILTAKEISRMDFKGLDLVVLSACQTALGKVTSEGVFGLQRGFKKAGAQTIVMSLWKVSDESTALLMIEFYKNLAAGQSKRTAFLAAQQKVRDKYPDPKHWAAFVMVDGLK